MPFYIVYFAQFHEEFRLPELESLAVLENVKYSFSKDDYSLDSPFFKIELESDADAARLARRSILIRKIYELWGEGETYEKVHEQVKSKPERWDAYMQDSFKFTVDAFGMTITAKRQVEIINSFGYLGFQGDIDMKTPQQKYGLLEDWGCQRPSTGLKYVYMGRLVARGNRDLVKTYNLKKRKYLGTTSMDAELSLIMANQALATDAKMVYDPFVGTGSFLFTCAHFGAYTMGSDIDGRQIRGKSPESSIQGNVAQYNLQSRVVDTLVFDVCHHPWRCTEWLDAIVTAPYGVRAGAKTLGRREGKKYSPLAHDGPRAPKEEGYPPTRPYEMSEVVSDLLTFAARHLRVGGRLVYWLPTVVDDYSVTDIPSHAGMVLLSNSEQNFGQWSRRLITMEKTRWISMTTHRKTLRPWVIICLEKR
ncbi:tRNA guanosine-2'-O-methyltransferase [Hesseltinella vesiculosa]|uniref:tRNA guanosine-2'-O-methyltransferase n=1 Tax=Hesseltinella vesiculosa TaxID=101127 RepID=A0A1X2G598_9FUNG|nr:tRNA guanosine-2'-O-methyltransferase [Hesseltinella vesiculosa]